MAEEKKGVRIYLQKNDITKNEKLPYFNLVLPPEQDDGEWVRIGALWKAKTGNGYSGQLNEGITIDTSHMVAYSKKGEGEASNADAELDALAKKED